jgi:hypothetical protein
MSHLPTVLPKLSLSYIAFPLRTVTGVVGSRVCVMASVTYKQWAGGDTEVRDEKDKIL